MGTSPESELDSFLRGRMKAISSNTKRDGLWACRLLGCFLPVFLSYNKCSACAQIKCWFWDLCAPSYFAPTLISSSPPLFLSLLFGGIVACGCECTTCRVIERHLAFTGWRGQEVLHVKSGCGIRKGVPEAEICPYS